MEAFIADGGGKKELGPETTSVQEEEEKDEEKHDPQKEFFNTFVVEGKDGKPCIKDPLYKKAYKSVPVCRFPKQRGQNSIIGTMSRFHTFIRWSIKRGYLNRDPYDDYVIGTASMALLSTSPRRSGTNYTRRSSRTTPVWMSSVTFSSSNASSDAVSAT